MTNLIRIRGLRKYYPIYGGLLKRKIVDVKAVDGVSLDIQKGECFGLVGESGCGKTTLGKTIIRLFTPHEGSIYYNTPDDVFEKVEKLEKENPHSSMVKKIRSQYDLATYHGRKLKLLRRKMQIVYQDPTTSLDPRMLIKDIVAEPIVAQGIARGPRVSKMVLDILERVGLTERHLYRYPHEFSGGQRQRIAVARALVLHPEFVVLDEPTSAVDVSVRAQLLRLFQSLREEFGLTYMFVSHDLSVVQVISDRVGVMYLGKVVEVAETGELYNRPLHPYSNALFASIPIPDPTKRKDRVPLTGEVPSPVNPPSGCSFHPRCPIFIDTCRRVEPQLVDVGNGHLVACHVVAGELGK